MRLPSGDQRGEPVPDPPSDVSCTGFEPSSFTIHSSKFPDRSEVKAMRLPSGEYSPSPSTRDEAINFSGPLRVPVAPGPAVRQIFTCTKVWTYARRSACCETDSARASAPAPLTNSGRPPDSGILQRLARSGARRRKYDLSAISGPRQPVNQSIVKGKATGLTT